MADGTATKYATGAHPDLPPPRTEVGVWGWMYHNLFHPWHNAALTFVGVLIVWWTVPPLVDWLLLNAYWAGSSRADCPTPGEREGACWVYIKVWFKQLMYGRYPDEQLWRINSAYVLLALGLLPLIIQRIPERLFAAPSRVRQVLGALLGVVFVALLASGVTPWISYIFFWAAVAVVVGYGFLLAVGYPVMAVLIFLVPAFGHPYLEIPFGGWPIFLALVLAAMGLAAFGRILWPRFAYRPLLGFFMLFGVPIIAFCLFTGGTFTFDLLKWLPLAVLVAGLYPSLSPKYQAAGWIDAYRRLYRLGATALLVWLVVSIVFSPVEWNVAYHAPFPAVETPLWGGLFLTLVIALTGIVASLPIGVVLALGRRSHMPVVRAVCVAFIELWRGVPLITVLFMASVMFPLFMPEGVNFDKLVRALVGVMLFAAAYMAEVVRGGLQAIPKGQYEAAESLGLSYWQSMGLIILPQALKIVIPGIVNTFIGLFKDTTLVLIIGLFDFLGMAQAVATNPDWLGFYLEGYIFVGFGFWLFCFGMSRYSQYLERRLHTGH